MSFKKISIEESKILIEAGDLSILDVRDPGSYEEAHIEGAVQVDESTIDEFVTKTDKTKPLLIYCFHGNTSQGAAEYFVEQGFEQVYSMEGGFEEWKTYG